MGSRILRTQMRQAMTAFTSIGVPASRLGLMLEFVSGVYGRNGLKPASAWFDYVKLNALAAREVARELGLPTVWSWGWATYTEKSPFDADKQAAACVYLWTRSQSACDGPAAAGPDFDPSLTVGQLQLPPRVFCTLGSAGVIASATRAALAGVTRDPETALAIAFGWGAARAAKGAGGSQIAAAEQAVIDASFGGNRSAYLAALKRKGANRGLARAALGAELRRIAVEAELTVPPVPAGSVASFADAYAGANARLVTTKTPVRWLGGRTRGIAIAGFAPGVGAGAPHWPQPAAADSGRDGRGQGARAAASAGRGSARDCASRDRSRTDEAGQGRRVRGLAAGAGAEAARGHDLPGRRRARRHAARADVLPALPGARRVSRRRPWRRRTSARARS